ncbi:helix-turn-helix domain-containing protein [Pseudomonas schmalbachii]|uniref:Helix-turn-helix transcriptional regulator n=1 Tax=Pseudomonas schmalbachii TaxID=2816993 RepID=A0ABS3TXP3_9PSED|nr:XRE family transcriptional regulator [Pseudomonas schmalbachii]MBO3277948.1 helix-turn-helix transcriptional regulator [Pseudomonas schmalbachii]
MSEASTSEDLAAIAAQVRDLRKRKGVTLQALADGIGRSVGFVSQVERGLSRPAVDDLVAISQVLGVSATYFFGSGQTPVTPWITRPDERRTLTYARGAEDSLVSPRLGGAFFMLETRLEPGADSGERNLVDSSEQGGYVLEGELSLWLDDELHVLQAGDGFQIPSHMRSRYANRGKTRLRVLWIYA